jgi:hypothetical protein
MEGETQIRHIWWMLHSHAKYIGWTQNEKRHYQHVVPKERTQNKYIYTTVRNRQQISTLGKTPTQGKLKKTDEEYDNII